MLEQMFKCSGEELTGVTRCSSLLASGVFYVFSVARARWGGVGNSWREGLQGVNTDLYLSRGFVCPFIRAGVCDDLCRCVCVCVW